MGKTFSSKTEYGLWDLTLLKIFPIFILKGVEGLTYLKLRTTDAEVIRVSTCSLNHILVTLYRSQLFG